MTDREVGCLIAGAVITFIPFLLTHCILWRTCDALMKRLIVLEKARQAALEDYRTGEHLESTGRLLEEITP